MHISITPVTPYGRNFIGDNTIANKPNKRYVKTTN